MMNVLNNDTSTKKACLNETASARCERERGAILKAEPFQVPKYKNGQCMDMAHIFRKHVKPKKQHEIQQLGQVIQMLSQMTHCRSVIDVGAGLGHLSRLLTFLHGLQVTTVEASDGHAPKAAEFDKELKKDVLKKLKKTDTSSSSSSLDHQNQNAATETHEKTHPETISRGTVLPEEESLPSHVVCYIQPDIAASQFLDIVRTTKLEDQTQDSAKKKFLLAGLHACGDLTPTLLKVFVRCPSAVALASVGCCYMKMNACSEEESSSSNGANLENYPMSSFLKEQANHQLNYESREMACHFADAYCQRLKDNPVHLKIHSYRAALQYLIKTVNPDFAAGQVRLVCKKGAQLSFPQYASEVLKKLNIDVTAVPDELLQACEEMTLLWKRVVAFYTIRLSIAPAVETLILLDRILFLREFGINSVLVPIFNSRLSPRNFALLAVKS